MDDSEFQTVSEAAGFWDARLRAPDCSDAGREAFAAWRDSDTSHRQAFERLQTIVAGLRKEMSRAELRSLRDSALAMGERRTSHMQLAIAASIVCILVLAGWAFVAGPFSGAARGGTASYTTGIGEQTQVTLQDGSTLELNAKTRVRVGFDHERRAATLLEGQALFHVAKDSTRPFTVYASDRQIRALGTAFDVRLERSAVRVTLLEGKVAVSLDEGSNKLRTPDVAPVVVLKPGEQLVATIPARRALDASPHYAMPPDAVTVRMVDTAKVTGWRDGRVFLDDQTLADAVTEMNKHSAVQITVSDPSLNTIRVNGMFRAGEQLAFVSALEDYFPIVSEHRFDREIVLRARQTQK